MWLILYEIVQGPGPKFISYEVLHLVNDLTLIKFVFLLLFLLKNNPILYKVIGLNPIPTPFATPAYLARKKHPENKILLNPKTVSPMNERRGLGIHLNNNKLITSNTISLN